MELRSPNKVLTSLSAEKEIVFNDVMESIIRSIETHFNGEPLKTYLYQTYEQINAIKHKVISTMENKGWSIEFRPTQSERDEYITPIVISAKT